MPFNVRGIKNSGEELGYYLHSARPDILALQETFLNKKLFRYRLPGYTCIEAKTDIAKGGTGLLLAVRNKSGLQISEFKSSQNWISGIIHGKYQNGKVFDMLVTDVHIPSAGIRRSKSKDEIFGHIQ
ncbi:hypothetical protein AYI68_g3890, partial [Smittium mucronatum]